VIMVCRAVSADGPVFSTASWQQNFVWTHVDVNEDSSRLGYDTVLTSKCDVVCGGKIVVNYWRFTTCTPHHTSFEHSNQEDRDGQGM